MGLDITAYEGCTAVSVETDEDGDPVDQDNWDKARAYINPHFIEQADGVIDRQFYDSRDCFGFRAGSYGGYNQWRNKLASVAGYTPDDAFEGRVKAAPFYEIVNFSDCEGVIGPKTSAKLLADFLAFERVAEQMMTNFEFENYRNWTKAFAMASQDGFVSFH